MTDTATPNYRFNDCDQCDQPRPCVYEVCLPRPSDPTEMACVLAFCQECVDTGQVLIGPTDPNPEGGLATFDAWETWCRENGLTHG